MKAMRMGVNFQKKFDVVTETLNIFDMSFLVSGTIMLMLCLYVCHDMRIFLLNENHQVLSILACILLSYVMGLVCRTTGKYVARYVNLLCDNIRLSESKSDCEELLRQKFSLFEPYIKIEKPGFDGMKYELVYSYMWMKLDTKNNPACRNRFLYVSRIWVLRAIYEGLIPSVIFLAVILISNEAFKRFCVETLCGESYTPSLLYLFVAAAFLIAICVVVLISREIQHCNETQKREVLVAYYDFFVKASND